MKYSNYRYCFTSNFEKKNKKIDSTDYTNKDAISLSIVPQPTINYTKNQFKKSSRAIVSCSQTLSSVCKTTTIDTISVNTAWNKNDHDFGIFPYTDRYIRTENKTVIPSMTDKEDKCSYFETKTAEALNSRRYQFFSSDLNYTQIPFVGDTKLESIFGDIKQQNESVVSDFKKRKKSFSDNIKEHNHQTLTKLNQLYNKSQFSNCSNMCSSPQAGSNDNFDLPNRNIQAQCQIVVDNVITNMFGGLNTILENNLEQSRQRMTSYHEYTLDIDKNKFIANDINTYNSLYNPLNKSSLLISVSSNKSYDPEICTMNLKNVPNKRSNTFIYTKQDKNRKSHKNSQECVDDKQDLIEDANIALNNIDYFEDNDDVINFNILDEFLTEEPGIEVNNTLSNCNKNHDNLDISCNDDDLIFNNISEESIESIRDRILLASGDIIHSQPDIIYDNILRVNPTENCYLDAYLESNENNLHNIGLNSLLLTKKAVSDSVCIPDDRNISQCNTKKNTDITLNSECQQLAIHERNIQMCRSGMLGNDTKSDKPVNEQNPMSTSSARAVTEKNETIQKIFNNTSCKTTRILKENLLSNDNKAADKIKLKKTKKRQRKFIQLPINKYLNLTDDTKRQKLCENGGEVFSQRSVKKFSVPYKDKTNNLQIKSISKKHVESYEDMGLDNSNIVQVDEFNCDHLAREVLHCHEVLLTLQYADCRCQLLSCSQTAQPKNLMLLYKNRELSEEPVHELSDSVTKCIFLELKEHIWAKKFTFNIFNSSVRKLCYKGQELLLATILYFQIPVSTLIKITLLDLEVGSWLLDPDHPPPSFLHMLSSGEVSKLNSVNQAGKWQILFEKASELIKNMEENIRSRGMWKLFIAVEIPIIPILALMESFPLHVNSEIILKDSVIVQNKLNYLEKKAHSLVGHSFSLTSHCQLAEAIYDYLQLGSNLSDHSTKNNERSISELRLTYLQTYHELPSIVLQHRQLQKLKSTYMDGILQRVTNGQLYNHWEQTATATGRLTSYHPNIQSVPKLPVRLSYTEESFIAGKKSVEKTLDIFARKAFISRTNYRLLSVDYQQIEFRMLAHLSEDERLIEMFNSSQLIDIFTELTSSWLNKSFADITELERDRTKRVIYSVIYGVGKEKLSEYLKIGSEQAKSLRDNFLSQFPSIKKFTQYCMNFCKANGYTSTILNRQRCFPQYSDASRALRARAFRQATNFCVQGSAADICKSAMVHVISALNESYLDARLLVQIHDELLLEVLNTSVEDVADLLRSVMENSSLILGDDIKLRVPLKVVIKVGQNWANMTEISKLKSCG